MKQILIVEDDELLNKMLVYNLHSESYGIVSVETVKNCGKARTGNYMPTCRSHPKNGDNTCDCFITGSF